MTGIVAAFSTVLVVVMMASTVNARVINKRAAFYIANDTMCIVDGELYFNGDPVPTDDHCEKCTCRPPGFSCVLRDCEVKPGCKAVRKDGECCPDYICGCSHNGIVYKDGDFIRDLQNPCYTCRCHGSSISCTFADCLFRSDCGPEYIQGECCPRYDHCPPLSTTQRTTTVITTVPITYDEITKPLFNLTSPPHERLATHTTIFPATGTVTVAGGGTEAQTTEQYVKIAPSVVSTEATQTTHDHDSTVTQDSDTSRVTQTHTSTVTTVDLKSITEKTSEVYGDSSQKSTSLTDEILSTASFSTDATFLATDVKVDTETKELTSAPVTEEHPSEGDSFSEELHDVETTKLVTEVSHDVHTYVPVTGVLHDDSVEELVTGMPLADEDESETEISSGTHTVELVTEVSHDSQAAESTEGSQHDTKIDDTPLESDETVGVPFSEEVSKPTLDFTRKAGSEDAESSVNDIPATTTDMPAAHEELEISPEDEVGSTHGAFSLQPEAELSEGTSSLVTTVTMSGEIDTEVSSVKVFTITETDETQETHSHVPASESFHTEVEGSTTTTTQGTHEHEITSETLLPVVTLHSDPRPESETEDKTSSSSEHSVSDDSHFSTVQSETESHSFSIGSVDDDNDEDDDSTDEPHINEEISTQDAEELNLFTGSVASSDVNQESSTIHDHITHLSSSETTSTQSVTNKPTEEHSANPTEVIEGHLHTEHTEEIDTSAGDTSTYDHWVLSEQGITLIQPTEEPHSSQRTESVSHSHETTTETPVYKDSDDVKDESSIDGNANNDVEEFVASLFTEDVTGSTSDLSHSTTDHQPYQIHPLNEIIAEANVPVAGTVQSSSEHNEDPQLLSENASTLSPTGDFNDEGQDIHTVNEGSSQPPVILTTGGTTEAVLTMEAESDLLLTTSEDSSASSSADEIITISSSGSEPSELSSMLSELLTTVLYSAGAPATVTSSPELSSSGVQESTAEHTDESELSSLLSELLTTAYRVGAPATVTSSPELSSSGVHESTAEHTDEDELSIKSKENELSSEKSHVTSTVHSEQDTSGISQDNDVTLTAAEIVSDDLDNHKHVTDISSTIKEDDEHVTSESNISYSSRTTVRTTLPEESNAGGRNDISSTVGLPQSETTSLKQTSDEPKPTETHDEAENVATIAMFTPDSFNKVEEHSDVHSNSASETERTTDSQGNTGIYITEHDSEVTMDAEESIVSNGFESITDHHHMTENDESDFGRTTQDHAPVGNEDSDAQDHFSVDGESYNAPNGEHLRTSRSTSSNSMDSSITVQYPENSEFQSQHTSDSLNENTGTTVTSGTNIPSFDKTEVDNDENKFVTVSLHTETVPTNVQYTVESTHSTYVNSAEVSSLSLEPLDDSSSNTDDSYQSTVTKVISYEADAKPDDKNIGEISEDESQQKVLRTSTVEISQSTEPTTDLLKDNNIAPDLIIPLEHQANAVPFNSVGSEIPIISDHSTDVTKEEIANPSTTLTQEVKSGTSALENNLENSETENEDSSQSYDQNNVFGREYDEDSGSHFSFTSERHDINEATAANEISTSTTENRPTISIYTMDAEAETEYLDDSTHNNDEHTKDQSDSNSPWNTWNTQLNSEQESVSKSDNDQTSSHFDSEKEETIVKEFQSGPEKGGELFEPTVPILSAVNVHKGKDQTATSTDFPTAVKYLTSTDMHDEVTLKNEATPSPLTELVDQTQKHLDSDHVHSSTLLGEEQYGKLTTSSPARDFTSNSHKEEVDTVSKNEMQSFSESSGTTYFQDTDDLGLDTNAHKHIYHSILNMELNTDVPTTEEPKDNEAGTTVSAKFTFTGDEENRSSSEYVNGANVGEVESDEQETEEHQEPEQQNEVQPSTTETNSIFQRDEIGKVVHTDASKNADFREPKDTREEFEISSHHEEENIVSETTKESDVSLNDIMLSDGVGNMMHFTDVRTDGADTVTDHDSITEHEAVNEEASEILSYPQHVTNDQNHYLEGSSGENKSGESATINMNTDVATESRQFEDSTTEGKVSSEKNAENSVSPRDHTEGLFHTNDNDHDHHTEQFSTSYYKSTTPLPLLLFNEFVEKVKEDSLVNQNSQPVEEQDSTAQPQEVHDVLNDLIDGETEEDTEKQSENGPEISVFNNHQTTTTTERNSNEHDSTPATPTSNYEKKQTEIHSTSSPSEEFISYSFSTENSHRDKSQDESEKVSDTTTNSQVTEQTVRTTKHHPRVFVIRISHDYPSGETKPQKKEEYAVQRDGESYLVKSTETIGDGLNNTKQEHNEISVTTEGVATEKNEEKTENTLKTFHELHGSPTSQTLIESTSLADRTVQDNTERGSSSDQTFNSQATEVLQGNQEEQFRNTQDDASELEKTADYVLGGTA